MAEPKFEKDLAKLEEIVEALEEGDLSLDDSLKRFEEGIKLAKRCEKALTQAEKKIEILTKDAEGQVHAEPLVEEGAQTATSVSDSNSDDDEEESEGESESGDELLF